ncbi:MAG TPA: coproporphyrinogen III oxidase [Flavobacteriales bacterium]|nr:coproporphyrinogen III oxidase [Flavobacteriales bacterium]|tara:strand:+ start:15787 stop:16920 length:1134 start_codon:yes stop_codon:yes gene_type:complete
MAGVYIHIPFCRKACHYCDFHFSTSLKTKDSVLNGIHLEALQRKESIADQEIKTIYLGGGTPSLLSSSELENILDAIHTHYSVSSTPEITLEANPEDITDAVVKSWINLGINRLSIGVQSFNEDILTWMNRSHNSTQASSSVKTAQNAGISNISIDLIYGVPHRTPKDWMNELKSAIDLNTPHISAYCLTIEPETVFGKKAAKGAVLASPSAASSAEFIALVERLKDDGIHFYEVSNFSKLGFESKHNSNYWNRADYLGLGPGAHSFIDGTRSWNISNNALYAKGVKTGLPVSQSETLSSIDSYNEYIMTNLRRREGINPKLITANYGVTLSQNFKDILTRYEASKDLLIAENSIKLTQNGFLLADRIASDLFLTHD